MTFAAMQARLRDRIAGWGNITWNEPRANRYLNDGVNEFCRLTHILQKQSSVTVTALDALYAFPTATGVASILRIWRASWAGKVLGVTDTRELDMYVGTGWRDAAGSEPQYVLTDGEDRSQIRIYPMVDTAANVGTNVLQLEYSYLPTEMDGVAVTTCALSDTYARAAVEWAVWQCLEDAVQSKQNPVMGDRAKREFWNLVGSARAEVNRGMAHNPSVTMRPRVIV